MCKKHIMLEILDPLLSALARLLVATGVPFPDLAVRLKAHYVQAAKAQVTGKPTDSRLSVMTGLQRRDVARLRDFTAKVPKVSSPARLVALWQSQRLPKRVPRSGQAPSFEALAQAVRKDIHARTLLDTLVASGTVIEEDGHVRLVQDSYQPQAGTEAQLGYLAKNLADHLAAASDNVLGQDPPHFERAVHYVALTEAQVDALRAAHASAQMALLTDLNQMAAEMKSESSAQGTRRFRAGAYFYDGEAET